MSAKRLTVKAANEKLTAENKELTVIISTKDTEISALASTLSKQRVTYKETQDKSTARIDEMKKIIASGNRSIKACDKKRKDLEEELNVTNGELRIILRKLDSQRIDIEKFRSNLKLSNMVKDNSLEDLHLLRLLINEASFASRFIYLFKGSEDSLEL